MRAWLLILLCLPVLTRAQGNTFLRFSTDDAKGLASNNVYCTYQDERGFIWVGTSNGLQRFDGNKFIHFQCSDSRQAQPLTELVQILPAGNGRMWLLYPTLNHVGLFDPVSCSYRQIPIEGREKLPAHAMVRLWKDSRGRLFLCVLNHNILRFDPHRNAFVDDNFFRFPKGWKAYFRPYEDRKTGRYWFTCLDSGLAVFDGRSRQFYTRQNNPQRIPLLNRNEYKPVTTEFFIDSKRRYWVFNWTNKQNKYCYDEQGRPLTDTAGLENNPRYNEQRYFFESRNGTLWVFGSDALYSLAPGAHRFHFYPSGLFQPEIGYHYVFDIMEDREGNTWISTNNGIYVSSRRAHPNGIENRLFGGADGTLDITDIIQDSRGRFWISSWGRGALVLDSQLNEVPVDLYGQMPGVPKVVQSQYRQVWTLFEHKKREVWLGCQAALLICHDLQTGKTRFLEVKEAEGATIRYITSARDGSLFFSTQRGHLIRYDGKKFTRLQKFNGITPKLFVDRRGQIWAAVDNDGLYCISADGTRILRRYRSADEGSYLFSNLGTDIDEVSDSTIVYATGALNFINIYTGEVTWKTIESGLPGNTARRLRRDRSGNLWIMTQDGLCRFNPLNGHITRYGRKDGLRVDGLTKVADVLSRDGRILFVGGNALLCFDPAIFDNRNAPNNVVLTDLRLFDRFLSLDSMLRHERSIFPPEQNTLTIFFSTLNHAQESRMTYYYKLNGVHKDWIRTDQNAVNFSLLPPGDYTFSVFAANIEGMRSPATTHFRFRIEPHFWQTRWFLIVFLLSATGLAYLLYRMRINRLLAVERVRSRVARDLHDDIGSTLSTINILGSMAKTKLQADVVRTSEYISKITENSQRIMEAMDDIVWSIRPDNDTMQKIVVRMKEFALSVLEAKDIAVDFNVDANVAGVRLHMEARRDLFLIFKEAVNNAAKYSQATKVTIRLACRQRRLVLHIEDDGVGFDPASGDGNGLGNMEKRATALRGRFHLESAAGKGTRITVNLPLA